MTRTGQKAALAAVFAFGAQGLWADVTPEEVWQNWQDAAAAQGRVISAESTEMSGDTLTVTGVTVTLNSESGQGSALIGEIRFQDKGDGTVAIVVPDSYPVHLTLPAAKDVVGAVAQDLTLTISMPDAEMTASGAPGSISYQTDLPVVEIAADVTEGTGDSATTAGITAKLTEVIGNYLIESAESGQNMTQEFAAKTFDLAVNSKGATGDDDVAVTVSLTDLAGKANLNDIPAAGMADLALALKDGMTMDVDLSYGTGSLDMSGKDAGKPIKMAGAIGGGSLVLAMAASGLHYDTASKSLSLNVAGTDSASGGDFGFAAVLADFTSQFDLQGAEWMALEDFPAALRAGLKMTGALGLGASSFDFNAVNGDKVTKIKTSIGGAGTSFAMDAGQMKYGLTTKAVSVALTAPEIPVPDLSVELGELAFEFAVPVSKTGIAAPFSYLTKVIDLKIPEALWMMADPAGSLGHGPATVIIDTKGTLTLTEDLLNETAALQGGAPSTPLLNSLDLTQILVKFAGAEVSALGGFTFDNSDTTTIPDMPLPTGKIDIKALGVNGLVDKLVVMGLVPQDQAMQGRMMISMFAKSSSTADEITSTLEFKDKQFFANGARLQ